MRHNGLTVSLPDSSRRMFRTILSDLRRKARWCYESDGRRQMLKVLFTDGTPAMVLYRLMQASRRWRLAPLEMIFNKLNSIFCNCIIGRGAEFGPGLVLVHSTGIVINGAVRGGANVTIEHQVTIGAERRQSPRLGDNVFIGAGAKVIGPVHVGDEARIGANAVVVADVPAGATVVGIPARVVRMRPSGVGEQPGSEHGSTVDRVASQEPGSRSSEHGPAAAVDVRDYKA